MFHIEKMEEIMVNVKELKDKISVERVTVSCALSSGRRGDNDFVSLTVHSKEGDFTLEESHIIHKLVSSEATEMAYMDAIARGHLPSDVAIQTLKRQKDNYRKLIEKLEDKFNKTVEEKKDPS
jgi:hypothetical protein